MRHHFLRLFLSIVLIVVSLIVVQIMVLLVGSYRASVNWRARVFDEFVDAVEAAISEVSSADESSVFNLMLSNTSERISGLLLRNGDGEFVATVGRSPMGEQLPTPARARDTADTAFIPYDGRMHIAYQTSIEYTDVEIASPAYEIALRTTDGIIPVLRDVSFRPLAKGPSMTVALPRTLTDQDIVGSIAITLNGEIQGYIDVMVFRINYYSPTAYLLESLIFVFFFVAIPFALVLSIILAAIVSKRNEKSVHQIQNALGKLSLGEFDISLPKQHTEEMSVIADSISTLAEDLKRHQISRKEWIRNISHDLNTPVTSLNILIDGALDKVFPLDDKLMLALKKENDTLSSRIASVGYYSYLLSPDAAAEPVELDAFESSDEVLSANKLSCTVEGDDIKIYADPALFSRALLEVLRNASDYGDSSLIPVISFHKGGDGSSIIEIRNKGSLPHPLPQFFEPWARGDESRTSGGSGLGLPIVYQIMEIHKGSVSIEESGGFVIVTLSFPARKE